MQFLLKNEMVEAIVCIPPSPEQPQGGLVVHLRIQVIPGDAFGLFVLPADRRLDSRAVRDELGTRRTRFASAEELYELAGLVPMTDVLGGRAEIMRAVHALIDAGEFKPSRGGEELVA